MSDTPPFKTKWTGFEKKDQMMESKGFGWGNEDQGPNLPNFKN